MLAFEQKMFWIKMAARVQESLDKMDKAKHRISMERVRYEKRKS
jgi:hypothetical protein